MMELQGDGLTLAGPRPRSRTLWIDRAEPRAPEPDLEHPAPPAGSTPSATLEPSARGPRHEPRDHRDPSRYANSSLDRGEAEALCARFMRVVTDERRYLDRTLRLPALAEELGARPHHLSQAINQVLGRSFLDVVNEYRVEEAKRLLTSEETRTFTILAVAMDAGFNSKSAFNLVFKSRTGMTPSEFQRRHPVRTG